MLVENSRRIIIHDAAYTSAQTCPLERNSRHKFARFYLDVRGASGTGGLTLSVRGYSFNGVLVGGSSQVTGGVPMNGEAMGNPGAILTAPAAITATGVYIYELGQYPQAASGAVQLTVARDLPIYWDVQVAHADGSTYTYSVSVELVS